MRKVGVVTEWDGTGYGPNSRRHWGSRAIYWKHNPADYKKIPIRLDPSWAEYKGENWGSASREFRESREAWNKAKQGWEWLYDAIDLDKDGKVSTSEYQALQDYKQKDRSWTTTLRAKPLAELLQK